MSTPVLIPARNEAEYISQTLSTLTRSTEPIVISNGSLDATADIARTFGVTVIENDVEGKFVAIQSGLRYLGRRATDPVLILDADSRPVSNKWPDVMRKALEDNPGIPILAGGPVYFTDHIDPLSGLFYSLKPVLEARSKGETHIRGANMLLHIATSSLLNQILSMPNYWQGEEAALSDVFTEAGGQVKQVLGIKASVVTDGSRLTSLWTRVRFGADYTHRHFVDSYLKDAPPSAISYWDGQDQ